MTTVQELAEEIVAREGGFVNDPSDPGGATNHGVTIHTLRRLGIDLTGDAQVTEADVRLLTRAQAIEIFIEHYFRRPGLSDLPPVLQAGVFDMYVNAGAAAVRLLQRMLTEMGFACRDDGVLGPQRSMRKEGGEGRKTTRVSGGWEESRRTASWPECRGGRSVLKGARGRGSEGGL